MKLNVKREEVASSTKEEKSDKIKNEDIKLIQSEIKVLKEQNIALASQLVKVINYQKISVKENLEMTEIIKNFDNFIKEVGNKFSEFGEYFENNNSNAESLDYDKIALIVHKYDLAKKRKK